MKPILIDELLKTANISSEFKINLKGVEYSGYQIAKPLNYYAEYLSKAERKEMADAIMNGKAIAVSYFEDLTEAEQQEYVKAKLKK